MDVDLLYSGDASLDFSLQNMPCQFKQVCLYHFKQSLKNFWFHIYFALSPLSFRLYNFIILLLFFNYINKCVKGDM